MAFETLLQALTDLFGSPRPKAPPPQERRTEGHRGIAAGDLWLPNLSAENVEKWQRLPGDAAADFVYRGARLPVHSSNVAAFQYDYPHRRLIVEFRNGSAYMYNGVSEQEAWDAARMQSKGDFVWTYLRVRGTKTGHRKGYQKLR